MLCTPLSSFLRFLSSPCLSLAQLFVNSAFTPSVEWKVGDTQVQIVQLAMAGEKQKAISTPFLNGVRRRHCRALKGPERKRETAT